MPLLPLSSSFSVAPQISEADLVAARDHGITHIICNRVEGEQPGQPANADVASTAKEYGLSFEAIPVGGGITPKQIEALDAAMAAHDKVLAYCASGRRSALLWAATRVSAGEGLEDVLAATQRVGFDFSEFREGLASLAPSG